MTTFSGKKKQKTKNLKVPPHQKALHQQFYPEQRVQPHAWVSKGCMCSHWLFIEFIYLAYLHYTVPGGVLA